MSEYGVQPGGFRAKPLGQILAEIELAMLGTFGGAIIQSAASPLGQLNGLFANLTVLLWEVAEDVYQSYDPDQAEGVRLDALATLRLLQRSTGEPDDQLRAAITNANRARIGVEDLLRALRGLAGVSLAHAFSNDGNTVDERGLTPHSVAAMVIGGDDDEVAAMVRRYVVPGIETSGNVTIETVVDGYCRKVRFIRPIVVPIRLKATVRSLGLACDCDPPNVVNIRDALLTGLSGPCRPLIGESLTLHRGQVAMAIMPGIQLLSLQAARIGQALASVPLDVGRYEIVELAADQITVAYG